MFKKRMKQIALILGLSLFVFSSCNDGSKKESEAEKKIEAYVVKIETELEKNEEWVKENWKDVKNDFDELMKDIKDSDFKSDLDKRWDKIASSVEEMAEKDVRYTPGVVRAYQAIGIEGAEASMDFVSKENILSKYEAFVNTVEANKKEYDVKDWEAINIAWDALNNRKEELEPLSAQDNADILVQKTKFAGLKAVHKTGAHIEEEMEN